MRTMSRFTHVRDPDSGEEWIETSLSGLELLNTPMLNKQNAFSQQERDAFDLIGLMPTEVLTLDAQLERELAVYESYKTPLARSVYLTELRDRNEILYFRLAIQHVSEMLPILYTPEVGEYVEQYSHVYTRPRGLYIGYPDEDRIEEILARRDAETVDMIVVTDSGAILGIGDQGVDGMGIPIAKLALNSLCGAVHPARALPITLDVGTDNEALLKDPLYLGWQHERVRGPDYERFIDRFVQAVRRQMPGVFLHWEDFARDAAEHNLEAYRDQITSFNDDIQGTAAVVLAAVLAGLDAAGQKVADQRLVAFGAGAAGLGNANGLVDAMRRDGAGGDEARARVWAVDRYGLVVEGQENATPAQLAFARSGSETEDWKRDEKGQIGLEEVVRRVRPTILIGTSTVAGAFAEEIVREMAAHVERPIILPLSNPTSHAEATPADLLEWTDGRALIATGSPFDPVERDGKKIRIGQSNNAFIFPGIALGVISSGAGKVTDNMLWAATRALSELSPARKDVAAGLLPEVGGIRDVCRTVGLAVAAQAVEDGVARMDDKDSVEAAVERQIWEPEYLPLRRKS